MQTADDPWPMRVFGMADALDQPLLDQWVKSRADGTAKGRIPINHLKLFADGALGSRGAALFEPYADATGELGLLTVTQEQLLQPGGFASSTGFRCVSMQLVTERCHMFSMRSKNSRVSMRCSELQDSASSTFKPSPRRYRTDETPGRDRQCANLTLCDG